VFAVRISSLSQYFPVDAQKLREYGPRTFDRQ